MDSKTDVITVNTYREFGGGEHPLCAAHTSDARVGTRHQQACTFFLNQPFQTLPDFGWIEVEIHLDGEELLPQSAECAKDGVACRFDGDTHTTKADR